MMHSGSLNRLAYAPQPAKKVKQFARSVGADLVGIARAEFKKEGLEKLRQFIEEGRHGSMQWMEDFEKRVNPQALLPGAKSVVVIAVNYYRQPPPLPKGHGKVARYAYGRDYHKVLRGLLKKLVKYLEETYPDSQHKICVDSTPILEKAYAVAAGLGFIGKNTTLITREFGSFVLLGEIITTVEFEPDENNPSAKTKKWPSAKTPLDRDGRPLGPCGTCTRCIDACPTQAILPAENPTIAHGIFTATGGKLDARRCISYLTIEHKGEIPREFQEKMSGWLFGCDICQEVCPYNQTFAKPLQLQEFKEVKIAGSSLDIDEILAMQTDEEYLQRFAGSPLMRTKRAGLQRNARLLKAHQQKQE